MSEIFVPIATFCFYLFPVCSINLPDRDRQPHTVSSKLHGRWAVGNSILCLLIRFWPSSIAESPSPIRCERGKAMYTMRRARKQGEFSGGIGSAASEGQDVVHVYGTEMIKKRKVPVSSQESGAPSVHAEQGELWLKPHACHSFVGPTASSTTEAARPTLRKRPSHRSAETSNAQRTLQDLLFAEGLLAVRLSTPLDSLEALQSQLVSHLHQNSLETRNRYAQSILKWFFPKGVESLVRHIWAAYNDENIV